MGKGFLGTSASLMLDVVVVSLVVVVPVLLWSLWLAKIRRNFSLHKWVQVTLSVVLLTVVVLFEVDMRLQGGFWAMAKLSPYYETAFLRNLLVVHLFFSVSTQLVWWATLIAALRAFPNPPAPAPFSPKHKIMAWISVIDMVATVATGLMVYYYGFWVE